MVVSFVGSSSKANDSLSMHPAPDEDVMPAPVDSASGDEWPAEHWHMPNPQETIDTVMFIAPPPAHMEVPHTFFDGVAKLKPLENLSRLRLAMLQAMYLRGGFTAKGEANARLCWLHHGEGLGRAGQGDAFSAPS